MSHDYVPVQWNRNKIIYDLLLWSGILVFLVVFVLVSSLSFQGAEALSPMILFIRALATCAFVLLSLILCIGPLTRLSERFLPLLYNRRHMGVSMFLLALTHAILALIWYHGFGVESPLTSLFNSPGSFSQISDFPFQQFGAVALLILFVLAGTSHDYWNTNLGAPFWKALHMCVYLAYALLVLHVATGAMQNANTGYTAGLVFGSLAIVGGLHLAAIAKSRRARVLGTESTADDAQWISAGRWQDIPNNRGITVGVSGAERIALFRYDDTKLAAVSNLCKHQNGPLGEGAVVDGCITCPWHGFQYQPEDGRSPAPFNERIATYELRLQGDEVFIRAEPLPEGTARPIILVEG